MRSVSEREEEGGYHAVGPGGDAAKGRARKGCCEQETAASKKRLLRTTAPSSASTDGSAAAAVPMDREGKAKAVS